MEQIEALFRNHYGFVCQVIYRYVRDRSRTEDIAQELFAELWVKREQWVIHTSPQAYLRRMAISRALNHLRDNRKHQWDDIDDPESAFPGPVTPPDVILQLEEQELANQIRLAVEQLPEKCRVVFQLSRTDQMTYAEIAAELGISIKTVENQIGKALRLLRNAIGPDRGQHEI